MLVNNRSSEKSFVKAYLISKISNYDSTYLLLTVMGRNFFATVYNGDLSRLLKSLIEKTLVRL